MNPEKTEIKTIAQQIREQFESLKFTQDAGNSHYASRDAEDLKYRNQSVEAFLGDTVRVEPINNPTRYDRAVIDWTIDKYEAMLDILVSQPIRSEENEILIDEIIAKTGEIFRYEQLTMAAGATALKDFSEHRRIASNLSMELLGGIDQPSFDTLFTELVDDAEASEQPFAKELLDLVGRRPKPETDVEHIELTAETRERIGEDLKVLFPGLREMLARKVEGPISPEAAVPIFRELLQLADIDEDWSVELNNGKAAETSSARKVVTIGRNRVPFKSYIDAVAVGFHESVVHAGRSESVTIPDTLDFEEGIATRLQQIISGERRTPGIQYYLSIGLQVGADRNNESRTYRDTFEILWRREALLMEKAGKPVDISKARAQAQRQVQRTRRGGVVDGRDASYFVGAQKAAKWLNQTAELPTAQRREMLAKVLTNKYDPTNPEHVAHIKKRT